MSDMNSMDQYQTESLMTAGDLSYTTLGLGIAGESGEVADLLKKHLGHGHPLDTEKLAYELGDTLWYVAMLAWKAGYTLSEIATMNRAKLLARYPDGFSRERSINRGAD